MVKIPTKLNVNKLKSASNKDYILAVLTDAKGNPLKNMNIGFADNGVKYIATDTGGKARYFVDHLKQGKHSIKVAFWGNEKYEATEKMSFSFWIGKIPTTILVRREGNYIIATLKDADGKPVSKVNVGFAYNGVKYIATNKNGEAKYDIGKFGYGTFTIKVKFFGNDTYRESSKIEFKFTNETPKPKLKKYGHATKSGCDNRGQNNGVYCAPHSMQEIIRNLTGKVISQSTLASWAGTTSSGTGHGGIESAIAKAAKYLGVNLSCRWYNFSELGWDGINRILNSNNQDCIIHNLYRLSDGHYEVINSISGSNVKVQNSLGDRCSGGCYCGYVENRSTSTFRSYINGISQKSVCVITRG